VADTNAAALGGQGETGMIRTPSLRPLFAAVTFAGLALLLSSCQPKPATPPQAAAPTPPVAPQANKPRVALVMKSLANEFFLTMENGAKAHQQQHAADYDLIANGIKDEQDVTAQINLVEQMIAQHVDAIVIAPADSKALIPVCKKAADAGIVVVNIDNKFDAATLTTEGLKAPFVGPDNRKGARLAGECLAKSLRKGDKVAIIEGAPNAFNGVQRKLGFEDAAKAAGLAIAASQSGYWETSKANEVVTSLLPAHRDLKAIMCANDSMALGAVAALDAAGRGKDVLVVGFDNITDAQKLMREKRLLCTVDQHADQLAVYGIEYALDILRNKTTPADKETPVDLITPESLPAQAAK
jgi:ribose transport system substrate-binding protein